MSTLCKYKFMVLVVSECCIGTTFAIANVRGNYFMLGGFISSEGTKVADVSANGVFSNFRGKNEDGNHLIR